MQQMCFSFLSLVPMSRGLCPVPMPPASACGSYSFVFNEECTRYIYKYMINACLFSELPICVRSPARI